MKYYTLQITLITLFLCVFMQTKLGCSNGRSEGASSLSIYPTPNSVAYQNRYGRVKGHVPDENSPLIIIKIAFHFFQKNDSTGNWNFEKTPDQKKRMVQIMDWINTTYTNCALPSDPIPGVSTTLNNSKIKFEVSGYYFYQNSELNISRSRPLCEAAVKKADATRLESFPIFVTAAKNAWGSYSSESILTFYADANPVSDFNFSQHLAHELGHGLDLGHTYDGSQNGVYDGKGDACCPEPIDPKLPDYLSDIFDQPWPNWCNNTNGQPCYHQNGGSCDAYDKNKYCTNNLMGGANWNNYISPMQMGKMRRAMALNTIRKYAKEESSSTTNWMVNENETWDFDIQMYQDILVTSGTTLTITGKVAMANQGKITLENGAHLIINGGAITCWGNLWNGIVLTTKSSLLLDNASIDNAELPIDAMKRTSLKIKGVSMINKKVQENKE